MFHRRLSYDACPAAGKPNLVGRTANDIASFDDVAVLAPTGTLAGCANNAAKSDR
jgi:hypothetical protein